MKSSLFDNPEWLIDRLTGKKKISCADYAYFKHNDWLEKTAYGLCVLLGNPYRRFKS